MKVLLIPAVILCCSQTWAQNVHKTEVTGQGLVANFYTAQPAEPRPVIVVIGGSSGGIKWQDQQAETFAKNGFAALALAYFGMEGLPSDLERIPLEYFQRAITWLAGQPGVDTDRIGLCGVSKGGELVLLLAAYDSRVHAVAALVPGAYVFQSVATGWPVTSSWQYRGRELPFVPYLITQNFDRNNLSIMYRESIGQERYLAAAAIPVEKINGSILLISGGADKIWPSKEMSDRVVKRLERKGFTHEVEHISYPNAGHSLSSVGADPSRRNGGTSEANLQAQKDTQRQLLTFFKARLGP
ncbi:MAG: acyl-CoA thioester hydrolase/BAAT C-terminal domain-containing protein [Acidobacteriota bacterium]|nr:acyl-CoA thioester hydrolase/BAAT C-terminal domain-containing protein [Acidobacteriota bacterium]